MRCGVVCIVIFVFYDLTEVYILKGKFMSENEQKGVARKLTVDGLLRLLQSQGFSYSETGCLLSYTQDRLKLMIDAELAELPLPNEIQDRFSYDGLVLSSTRLNQNGSQHPSQ